MTLTRRELFIGASATPTVLAQPAKPNILLILIDDMSWGALSCYGNKHVATPNLDRLAREGVRFTDGYVTPQCTPTRATLLTGQYTARNRMWHVIPWYGHPKGRVKEPEYVEHLPRESFTLAKGLRQAGYATACIGKWHLTTNADGNYNGLNAAAAPHYGFDTVSTASKDPAEFRSGDKGVSRFTDEALQFIERHRDRPFFCYLAHHTTHRILSAPADLVEKYAAKGYPRQGLHNATLLACIDHLDQSVGRLLSQLDQWNLTARTAVVFLTDNGGIQDQYRPVLRAPSPEALTLDSREFDNRPLRAGKGSAYEGGVRVPFLIRWPGVARAGTTDSTPVHIVDLLPTFLEMAGAKAPAGHVTDGQSLVPHLQGRSKLSPRRPLYWYMPFYDLRWASTPCASMREGDFKLIEWFGDYIDERNGAAWVRRPKTELYNLREDLSESNDLSASMKPRVEQMRRRLRDWIRSSGQSVPALNPAFDPALGLVETKERPTKSAAPPTPANPTPR